MAEIIGPPNMTVNGTGGYTVVPEDYVTYNWICDSTAIIQYGQGQPVAIVQWTSSGHFTLTCNLMSNRGATDSISITVDVSSQGGNPNPPQDEQ